jgi:flavin reductase (DIM6/NTAB) family NADH-FMN oxidoreductase RutF
MTGATGTRAAVPDEVFRDVIGRFASGVTIITTTADDGDHGTTASAVTSLSMDPPMLLICLNKTSDTQAAVLRSGVFGVNILAEDQGQVAYQFARKGPDKFAGVGVIRGRSGIPLVENALAHLECEVDETVTGGTHTVFLARVKEAAGKEGAPLTYFRGRFGRLESVREEEAYQAVRRYVLERRCALDQPLEPTEVAEALGIEPGAAVVRLERVRSGDGRAVTLEDSCLPAERFPGLLDHDLGGSVYTLMRDEYGLAPVEAVERLEAVAARAHEAEALGVPEGCPLMLVERTAYAAGGVPVEFARDRHRGDRARFVVRVLPERVRAHAG